MVLQSVTLIAINASSSDNIIIQVTFLFLLIHNHCSSVSEAVIGLQLTVLPSASCLSSMVNTDVEWKQHTW